MLEPRPATDDTILPLTLNSAVAKVHGKIIAGPVDLVVAGRGITIVLGPNGSGKTTLLRLMHGLQRVRGGSVNWSQPHAVARLRQSYVFQSPIMMRRRVVDSIAYPLILRGVPRKQARMHAMEWAVEFGLERALNRPAPVLSGGEKQKLSLARALITGPDILFLDEPCANLDGRATRDIEALLDRAQAAGTRIVMSTHDIGQARRLANEIVFMLGGKVHETGCAEAFFLGPDTPQAAAFINGEIVE